MLASYFIPFFFWYYCSLGSPLTSNIVVFDLLKCQNAARTLFEWVYYHHFGGIATAKENPERSIYPLLIFDLKVPSTAHLLSMRNISQYVHWLLLLFNVYWVAKNKLFFLINGLHFADLPSFLCVAT